MTSRHSSHAVAGATGGGGSSSPSNGSSRKHNVPSSKPASSPRHFTLSQAALLAALCSCLSIVLTEFAHTALSASQANHHDNQFGYSLLLAADHNRRNSRLQQQRRVSNISTVRSRESVQEVQSIAHQEGDTTAAVEEEEESADTEQEEDEADEEPADETEEEGEEEEDEAEPDPELIKVAGEEPVATTTANGVDPLSVKVVGLKTEDRTVVKADQLNKLLLRNETVDPEIKVSRGNITHPNIAWLMSFPNSGTSFTIHMTREASNTTTATNYAMEGDIKSLASTQAILGKLGEQGPFLELIRNRVTNVPQTILTKTHCTGFCSLCGPKKLLFETPRTFLRGCLTGTRAVYTNNGLEEIDVIYDAKLVTKAIHIFRHPLDNIVARFHLEFNEQRAAGNTDYVRAFPKNATGFHRWCRRSDLNDKLLETRYIDEPLKESLRSIPCFNEFFKYAQWHNMAFYVTKDHLKIPTMLLHYQEYSENFEKARDKVLNFLGLPLVGLGIEFHDGKYYRHYYTNAQKQAIKNFLEEYSSPDTWEQLKIYNFEIDPAWLKAQQEEETAQADQYFPMKLFLLKTA